MSDYDGTFKLCFICQTRPWPRICTNGTCPGKDTSEPVPPMELLK